MFDTLSARLLIMSHLSDAQELTDHNPRQANRHINFAKFVLLRYKDTSVEVDANAEWTEFNKKYPVKGGEKEV